MLRVFLFVALSVLTSLVIRSQDSIRKIDPQYFYSSLSTSYATSSNWQGADLQNFAFVGNAQYKHSLWDSTRSHTHQVLADLGYLKFVDSTWVKSVDRLQLNLLWQNTGKKFNHSYAIQLSTQFLTNTNQVYDFETSSKASVQKDPFSLSFLHYLTLIFIPPMKKFLVALAGVLSLIYLLNPTMGVFEILPDNIPLIGNIDEATATMVLLGVLRYFGWDWTNFFGKKDAIDFGAK